MSDLYDAEHIRAFYDAYGDREWGRLEADAAARVSFHIHGVYLRDYISAGQHVLEAGAGPGRFTIELARLGARVTVGDISPAQLELNRVKVAEAGCEDAVVSRDVLDIADLSHYRDAMFDAAVCYGGPLSYVFERADSAVGEMLRVVKPGGHVLLSEMSLLGGTRRFLPGVLALAREHGLEPINQVNTTGDLRDPLLNPNGHFCHMFRWAELSALLRRHPCEIVAASASNFLSLGQEMALESAREIPALWEAFLAWEVAFCREPGALDWRHPYCGGRPAARVSVLGVTRARVCSDYSDVNKRAKKARRLGSGDLTFAWEGRRRFGGVLTRLQVYIVLLPITSGKHLIGRRGFT